MSKNNILCLDLGTQTGWALHTRGMTLSGSEDFKPKRFEGGGMRFLRFTRWLDDVDANCGGITEIYFEEVRKHNGVDAAHAYGGFMGVLTSWCEQQHTPFAGVPVGTIKKAVTGKGNSGKEEVIKAIREIFPINPSDDNEADALALLHYVTKEVAKIV